VSTEALFLSIAIDAMEKRDVATADVEGAYSKADMVDVVIMIYEGDMVDQMVAANPEKMRSTSIPPLTGRRDSMSSC
jgi:hypothetical protein